MNWKAAAAAVKWNIRPYIGGRYINSAATETFNNVNPATESVLCRVPIGSAADVDAAVTVAQRRFNDGCWSELPPARRVESLQRLADLILKHKADFALFDCLEMGKPIKAALHEAEQLTVPYLRAWAGFADKLFGASAPIHGDALSFNCYEPRGVVGAITAWNFPTLNTIYKLAPALAAGNTLVLKPSELSSASALKIAELAVEAGIPEGVVNVVPGLGSTVGLALAKHPDVDLISFTGSTATGRKIMEYAAQSNGKPVMLECGGKSPHVVFADAANLDMVADEVVQLVVWNQGQVCAAHTRLIAHEKVKESLVERVVERACKYKPGDPLDENTTFGPLASPAQRSRVKSFIDRGLEAGAVAVLKGEIWSSGGCYVCPTVFDKVHAEMDIAREEIFGPVLTVQGFQTDEEAIALANGTDYGLAATAWTRDMARAKRVARAIRAGCVMIRTSGTEGPESGCTLGFQPQKASGFGSETGLEGLKSYSALKLVILTGT